MFANEIIVPIIETKENGIGRACKIITLDLFFISSPPWVYYSTKAAEPQELVKSCYARWNQSKTLMKSAAQMKLNPPTAAAISSEQSEDFTLRSNISSARQGGFSWKKSCSKEQDFFLSLLFEKELVRNPWFYWVLPSFSLQIDYTIKNNFPQ